jgi:hypothetical protein
MVLVGWCLLGLVGTEIGPRSHSSNTYHPSLENGGKKSHLCCSCDGNYTLLREKILQLSVPFYHLIGSWLYVESFSSRSSQVFKMDGKFFIFFCRLWK